jgi:pilus assembly protein Flp/PilA
MSDHSLGTPRWRREDGVTAIEYALIAALIAVVIIGSLRIIGLSLVDIFSMIGLELS